MPNAYNSNHTGEWQDDLFNLIYPIGSIYLSVNATSPATLFGGTWEQIQDKFLLCAGSTYAAGTTGGAASVTSSSTALTTSQIPAHTHGSKSLSGTWQGLNYWAGSSSAATGSSGIVSWAANSNGEYLSPAGWNQTTGGRRPGSVTFNATHTHSSVGGNEGHTHTVATMPPYLSVYVWKRIA